MYRTVPGTAARGNFWAWLRHILWRAGRLLVDRHDQIRPLTPVAMALVNRELHADTYRTMWGRRRCGHCARIVGSSGRCDLWMAAVSTLSRVNGPVSPASRTSAKRPGVAFDSQQVTYRPVPWSGPVPGEPATVARELVNA